MTREKEYIENIERYYITNIENINIKNKEIYRHYI